MPGALEPLVKSTLSLACKSEMRIIIVTVTTSRAGERYSNGRRDRYGGGSLGFGVATVLVALALVASGGGR
jgi:hypothetical protein